jgi:uncharacterized glyoxalase superfamily protein PhnB
VDAALRLLILGATGRSAPTATIVPVLIYDDVGRAIEWLCRASGFTERLRAERDGVIGHAKQCGARILQEPADMPFGERQYTAQDHAGHWWTFSQHIADVAPEDWGGKSRA